MNHDFLATLPKPTLKIHNCTWCSYETVILMDKQVCIIMYSLPKINDTPVTLPVLLCRALWMFSFYDKLLQACLGSMHLVNYTNPQRHSTTPTINFEIINPDSCVTSIHACVLKEECLYIMLMNHILPWASAVKSWHSFTGIERLMELIIRCWWEPPILVPCILLVFKNVINVPINWRVM